jgi:hypothetical protein
MAYVCLCQIEPLGAAARPAEEVRFNVVPRVGEVRTTRDGVAFAVRRVNDRREFSEPWDFFLICDEVAT